MQFHPRDYDLIIIKTVGDVRQEERFTDLGTKGIFTKELDDALLANEIDFAVHSLKDLPSVLPDRIHLVGVTTCLDPTDAFLSVKYRSFADLPPGAIVGSSSVRRRSQILSHRRDLMVKELRGNVETRIAKMKSGQYDAILLASAGIMRMGMEVEIRERLDPTKFVPCIGQGIVGVTSLMTNDKIEKILKKKQNVEAMKHALLLREFMQKAQGGCSVPLGCHLDSKDDIITMWGYLSDQNGDQVLLEKVSVPAEEKYVLVHQLVEKMEKKGFRKLIESLHDSPPKSLKIIFHFREKESFLPSLTISVRNSSKFFIVNKRWSLKFRLLILKW